jgi:hypothetical protein
LETADPLPTDRRLQFVEDARNFGQSNKRVGRGFAIHHKQLYIAE